MANHYVSSTKYTAVTQWAASTSIAAGSYRRQLAAPAVGSERVFYTALGGTSGGTEPTWVLTAGAAQPADNTITDWIEVTGKAIHNGDGGGNVWGAPHARLPNAIGTNGAGWAAAGDTIYIGSTSAETVAGANITITSLGTTASPIKVICVDESVVPPTTVTTGASITTTGTGSINMDAYLVVDGVTFNAGTGAGASSIVCGNTATTSFGGFFYNCTFALKGTAGGTITYGAAANAAIRECINYCYNCTYTFASTSQRIAVRSGYVSFIGMIFAATGSVPTQIFTASSSASGIILLRDCDLSTVTGTLCGVGSNSITNYSLQNCKLGNGVTPTTANAVSIAAMSMKLHNCDSADTNYRLYEYSYSGVTQHSTSTYRSGGATDGFTNISYQIISGANVGFYNPFMSTDMAIYNSTTGSVKTATIYLTSAASLTNAQVWVEWEYMADPVTPIGTSNITTRAPTILTTATPLTADTSTWTGGLGNNYRIQTTFTPQMPGIIKAKVFVAAPSTTINYDPLISLV